MYITKQLHYSFHSQTDITVAAHSLIYTETIVAHTYCTEEAFLSCGPKPEVLQNLFHTVWSIKVQQIFVVLQTGGPISSNLLEVITEIIDDATCRTAYPGEITDRMICAGTSAGGKGPCNVSGS